MTTSEYPLLYVFAFLLAHQGDRNTGSALDGVVFVFARAKAVVDSAGESAKSIGPKRNRRNQTGPWKHSTKERSDEKKVKNIQQRVFASGHPPNY